jgi:hypothetical protein
MTKSKKKFLLRKIVRVEHATTVYGEQRVELECGHWATASKDAHYRARCYKCGANSYTTKREER